MNVIDNISNIVDVNYPLSGRVQEGLNLSKEGRYKRKETWSKRLTVLDDSSRKLPLVTRKAMAVKKMLSEMPVLIKDHELLVGAAVPATILKKAALPEYATDGEKRRAAKKMTDPQSVFGHYSPYYPGYLKRGISGLKAEVETKREEARKNGTDPQKITWFESVLISLEGLETLIQRYRKKALALSGDKIESSRKEDWTHFVKGIPSQNPSPLQRGPGGIF